MVRIRFTTTSLLLLKAMALIILVAAATYVLASKNLAGEKGTQLKVTNQLLSLDKGFSKAASGISVAGTSCLSNVTFTGSQQNANTAVTAGDIVYDVQVNTTAISTASTCFTVSLVMTSSTGTRTSYGPVYLATGSSPASGQTVDCKFDLQQTSLPSSPFSFKVTVQ
jgi:hypothetical protein